jgi:hypothetical protein|tara:strand:+ start:13193 stop:13327 length:135 start_codon:yes stop_codon:yes gene_type:complete
MKVETTKNDLKWAIYEALNNLDWAMDGEEIKFIQDGVFKALKIT